jgi:hypothetical protein
LSIKNTASAKGTDNFIVLYTNEKHMKRVTLYAAVVFVALLAIACSDKKNDKVANNDAWPEMDEFHSIMADSFHPYKDSANLEPAKANAVEMAKVAEKWASAPLPEKVDNDEIKSNLAQLKNDANTFVQTAQSGDSVKIGESLTSLHDQFHKLQESWYGGHKKEDHKEH